MKLAERYSTARNSTSLAQNPASYSSPLDILGAAGLASHTETSDKSTRAAIAMLEAATTGKTGSKLALVEMLSSKLAGQMAKNRWKGDPRKIAQEVVAWYLHGTCQPCGGRGYESIKDTPSLSGNHCKHCHGTGKIDLPDSQSHLWLSRNMDGLIAMAGGKVMQKLAKR